MADYAEVSWTTPDGLRLAARDYPAQAPDSSAGDGVGPELLPVICLHGLTRNARDFEAIAPLMASAGRRVVAMDMRGRGRSAHDPDPAHYALPTYIGDVIGFAAALQIPSAVFFGTSMGGLIAMGLAQIMPGLIASMILNDVGPEVSPAGLARILSTAGSGAPVTSWADANAYVRRLNAEVYPGYTDADWDRLARRLFRHEAGRPVLDYDLNLLAPLKAPAGAGEPPPAPDLWPLFNDIARYRPILALRGAHSDILSADVLDRMAATAAGFTACTVPGVGHAPDLGEAGAVEAITGFLRGVG